MPKTTKTTTMCGMTDGYTAINVCMHAHLIRPRADRPGRPSVLPAMAEEEQILQDDPCLAKNKIAGDVQYCDRYWECEFGQPELYDCPNGLVWIGRNQGIADGCDYPWRHPNICKNKDLASKYTCRRVADRVGNSHIDLSSESLVFCEQKSKRAKEQLLLKKRKLFMVVL